jgi:hypothetical protein
LAQRALLPSIRSGVLHAGPRGIGRGSLTIDPKPGASLRAVTVTLNRARFAGLGTQKADFAVGSEQGKDIGVPRGMIALCDISIARRGETKAAGTPGRVRIDVRDSDSGALLPARVGLYDTTGRAPLPSNGALLVERFADKVRLPPSKLARFGRPRIGLDSTSREAMRLNCLRVPTK